MVLLLIIGINTNKVNAYDIPTAACKIHAVDKNLGEITIYVPCLDTTKFSYTEDNQLVLVSASNVTGYLSNTEDYTINFRPYYVGRYRTSNYGTDYIDLNFTKIYEDTNVNLFTSSDQYIQSYKNTILIGMTVFIGGVLCLIYMKR